jgi:hypothetical protein
MFCSTFQLDHALSAHLGRGKTRDVGHPGFDFFSGTGSGISELHTAGPVCATSTVSLRTQKRDIGTVGTQLAMISFGFQHYACAAAGRVATFFRLVFSGPASRWLLKSALRRR